MPTSLCAVQPEWAAVTRTATLRGPPADLKHFRVWVTDRTRRMQEVGPIPASDGKAQLTLNATSFTTLISVP